MSKLHSNFGNTEWNLVLTSDKNDINEELFFKDELAEDDKLDLKTDKDIEEAMDYAKE